MAAPYEALARVYDRWTATTDYHAWCSFLVERLGDRGTVLDVCCGTGRMIRLLQQRRHTVAGVDQSAAMLEIARASTAQGTILDQRDLSVSGTPAWRQRDAAICCFDSVNYFVTDEAAQALFDFVARSLRPGGLFIFDVNTQLKLESAFGNSHYGDDHGDFAYVWRNRCQPDRRCIEFLITLFTQTGTGYARHTEHHVQRWFSDSELSAWTATAGFELQSITDDYSERPAGPNCLRQTWVLVRT